nr:T9SS type A sorting domain-containing protein [Chitinophagaceae bacterium]
FSTFFVANNSAPLLPISIKNLKASWLANQGLVQWTTATEENAAGFDVERSIDGRNFETIGFVKAKGNSVTEVAYQFIDAGAASSSANKFFYRLRLKDLDGKFVYSTVVSIVRSGAANIVRMYPNPARSQVMLSVFANADETLQWMLTDAGGRVVKANRAGIRRGDNNISIDLSSLPAGLYQLSVRGAQINETMKLQKL